MQHVPGRAGGGQGRSDDGADTPELLRPLAADAGHDRDRPLPGAGWTRARPALRRLRRAAPLVGRRPRRLLVGGRGVLRRPVRTPRRARCCGRREMPGAEWFPGATLNYAEHALGRPEDADDVAVLGYSQTRDRGRADLGAAARPGRAGPRRAAAARRRPGRPGGGLPAEHPRDAGRVPRHREPGRDLGELRAGVRCAQRRRPVRPDRAHGPARRRRATATAARTSTAATQVAEIRAGLPTVRHVVHVPYGAAHAARRDRLGRAARPSRATLAFDAGAVRHPLCVLFSSGTTGKPKAIVHGHGGILLEHLKNHGAELGPAPRRPDPLVLHHRLDDVERAGVRRCWCARRS